MDQRSILIVDDNQPLLNAMGRLLAGKYRVQTASSGKMALTMIAQSIPSLVILDIGIPDLDGRLVCKRIRETYKDVFLPIILISGSDTDDQLVLSLASGANDFVAKPFHPEQLIAKIDSFLGVKQLYDHVHEDLSRLNQLKRFFSPQVADLLIASPEYKSCRKEITVIFVDLRGFTRFVEEFPPDDVMAALGEYYKMVGTEVLRHDGTIGCLAGDGIMAIFNDPVEITNHTRKAIECALAIRTGFATLKRNWDSRNYRLHFGAGIAAGTATVGVVGFDSFRDYAAIGAVSNLASRLCSKAEGNQILISHACLGRLANEIDLQEIGNLELKGIPTPVRSCNVVGLLS